MLIFIVNLCWIHNNPKNSLTDKTLAENICSKIFNILELLILLNFGWQEFL